MPSPSHPHPARVAQRCGLGRHGASRLKAAIPHADRFIDEGFVEAIFDERCKKRSDAIPDEQITWLVNECWLSNKYTRESEKKKDEVRVGVRVRVVMSCMPTPLRVTLSPSYIKTGLPGV